MKKETLGLLLGAGLFALAAWVLPFEMPDPARYTLALTLLMATWWITEALPLPITALLPLIVLPLCGVCKPDEATSGYSDPIIYLFLGGFMLAIAIERWDLHRRIALAIILLVGRSLPMLVLSFMLATGGLSMWISNTATALMMLPIGLAIIHQIQAMTDIPELEDQKIPFGKALLLGIAYASSIGGIATLVGTPTNMIFVGYVKKTMQQDVPFVDWLIFALPASLLLLLGSWWYLVRVGFKIRAKLPDTALEALRQQQTRLGRITREELWLLLVFGLVAFFWVTRTALWQPLIPNLTDMAIGLVGAVALFLIPSQRHPDKKLLDWETASKLPWDVILLFGGGLALASAFETSGLATWLGGQFAGLAGLPYPIIFLIVIVAMVILTEFASNVAAVSILLPVLGSLAKSLNIDPYPLMIGATCAASAGFMMPMGTAANALVFGTGFLKIGDMIRAGFWLDLLCILIFWIYTYFMVPYIF